DDSVCANGLRQLFDGLVVKITTGLILIHLNFFDRREADAGMAIAVCDFLLLNRRRRSSRYRSRSGLRRGRWVSSGCRSGEERSKTFSECWFLSHKTSKDVLARLARARRPRVKKN